MIFGARASMYSPLYACCRMPPDNGLIAVESDKLIIAHLPAFQKPDLLLRFVPLTEY